MLVYYLGIYADTCAITYSHYKITYFWIPVTFKCFPGSQYLSLLPSSKVSEVKGFLPFINVNQLILASLQIALPHSHLSWTLNSTNNPGTSVIVGKGTFLSRHFVPTQLHKRFKVQGLGLRSILIPRAKEPHRLLCLCLISDVFPCFRLNGCSFLIA